jgi:subtilisin family serine protease
LDQDCNGEGTLVSVVDTGWLEGAETSHSWLSGVGGDKEDDEAPAGGIGPYVGHGTFISGVIRTMAPRAEVVNERVAQDLQKVGAWSEAQMAVQLKEAIAKSPDIICLSSGVTSRDDKPMLGFQVFYEQYLSKIKNTVFVASAGNDGDRGPVWPAAFPWAIAVGALNADALDGKVISRAQFSCHGSWVDVYAPGEDLVNAFAVGDLTRNEPPNKGAVEPFNGMARWSGTSFSAPLVAGLIAARMSRHGLSAKHAADQLLRLARSQAVRSVGPVLMPGDACKPAPCCCGEMHEHRGRAAGE